MNQALICLSLAAVLIASGCAYQGSGATKLPSRIPAGQVVQVMNQGAARYDTVWVCRDAPALADLRKFSEARDEHGLAALKVSGGFFEVPHGTKVRVLDHDLWNGQVEVRIESGDHRGRRVFVSDGAIPW